MAKKRWKMKTWRGRKNKKGGLRGARSPPSYRTVPRCERASRSSRLILRVGAGPRSAVCGGRRVRGGCQHMSVATVYAKALRSRPRPLSPAGPAGLPLGPSARALGPRRGPSRTRAQQQWTSARRASRPAAPAARNKQEHYTGAHGRESQPCSAAAQKLLNVATRASGAMRKGAENSRLIRSDSNPGHQGSSRRQRAHTQDQPRGHSQRRLDRERAIHSCCIKSSLGASSDRGTSTRSSACSSPM